MKQKGLTIIEVLIALMIIGVIAAVITPLLTSSMQLNRDGRVKAQAITATESWLDRFRAKTLDFEEFDGGGVTLPYGYNYANDSKFVAAGDPDPTALNQEWQAFKFQVKTDKYRDDPLIWRITLTTTYKGTPGKESSFNVQTLVTQ